MESKAQTIRPPSLARPGIPARLLSTGWHIARGPKRSRPMVFSQASAVEELQLHAIGVPKVLPPRSGSPLAAGHVPIRHNVVEVHLQVKYKCAFGQHLAVVGSPQGWQTSSAVPMRWAEGDVWTSVLTLPYGCDIEYKYIVAAEGGQVVRWQEGTNNKLSLRNPGYLLHVTDAWAQDSRQVHEFGLPAAAAGATADTNMRTAGSWRAGSGSSSGSSQPAAAQNVLLRNNITCFTLNSSSSSSSQPDVGPEPAAVESASGIVRPAASAGNSSLKGSSSSTRSHDLPGTAAYTFSTPKWQQQQQQQDAGQLQQAQVAAATVDAAAVPASNSGMSSTIMMSEQPQQLQMSPPADALTPEVSDLLPLLQRELESALAALASFPGTEAQRADLLAEGRAVLQALQQQLQDAPPLPDTAELLQQQHEQLGAAAAAGASSSSPGQEGKQRSPSGSPAVSMASASEDEIAAALLSDDCEEACFCLVDAICSCMCSADGADADECYINNEAYLSHSHHSHSNSAGTAAAATAPVQPSPASNAASAVEQQVVTAAELAALQLQQQQQQLLHMSNAATAAAHAAAAVQGLEAARCSEEARAAAFAGVQRALQQSADLLEYLSDPCHPLMLKADRQVADAKNHLGHLLAA